MGIESKSCTDDVDVEDGIKMLLNQLPSDPTIWQSLKSTYSVDIFVGIFLEESNRMFQIPPDVSEMLADRGLNLVFDVYYDPPDQAEQSS